MFLLSKLLFFLIKPLTWVLILLAAAVFGKNVIYKRKALLGAVLLLLFFSNGWIFNQVVKRYEAPFPVLKKYDVGVLLGGFSTTNERKAIAFTAASDRLLQTISLYKNGVIKKILITSGSANLFKKDVKEADLAAEYLREIGIPDSDIIVENQSRNTKENIDFSYRILEKEKLGDDILIITSAWHIPRTRLIVRKHGNHHPDFYPTHHLYSADLNWDEYFIPNVETINNWGLLIKEWVGSAVTKIGIS